jgi:outer membrane protein TolC
LTEVSDSLIDYTKRREQRSEQEAVVDARARSVQLSRLRYQGGLDNFLQVLDAETRLFDGQLVLVDLKREELVAIVRLYRALGGGWRTPPPSRPAPAGATAPSAAAPVSLSPSGTRGEMPLPASRAGTVPLP